MVEEKGRALAIIGKVIPTMKIKIIAAVAAALVIALFIAIPLLSKDEPAVDTSYMVSLLAESSELTTAKLHYTGMTEFKDSGIAFINSSDFIMVYEATARIGIDLQEVDVSSDNVTKVITVSIPPVAIQDVKIDASSIKYFDQKFSLFNLDEKEDSNAAIALAEEAAMTEVGEMGVLQMAQDQSATLIKGILANAIPDGYVIEIRQKNS